MVFINIFQYLSIYLYFNKVLSLKTVYVNNLPLKNVSPLINKIREKYADNLKYVEIQPNFLDKKELKVNSGNKWKDNNNNTDINKYFNEQNIKEFGKLNKNLHRILIKRLIPHGSPPTKLEFDRKFKTVYRPLIRVHKTKPAPEIGQLLDTERNQNYIGMDKYGMDFHDYYDNEENGLNFVFNTALDKRFQSYPVRKVKTTDHVTGQLLQPFTVSVPPIYSTIDEEVQLKIAQEIEKLMKGRSRVSRMNIYDYFLKVLDRVEALRTYEKSGEDNDPLAPGKYQKHVEHDDATPKPKFWLPHYPPWNYWTYMKTIHQDQCPSGQVKIANLCIWIPPHK